MSILEDIIAYKKEQVENQKAVFPFLELEKKLDKFFPAPQFRKTIEEKGIHLIAEIKKASPSAGVIRPDFEPATIARAYEEGGASCLSIVTEDRFFQGDLGSLDMAKQLFRLPLLRKDFIVDEYQIYESKVHLADSVLFIASILGAEKLEDFLKIASDVGLDALTEVHSEDELKMALDAGADLIGINTRNLKDFTVDLGILPSLLGKVPGDKFVVAESGIRSVKDLGFIKDHRVNAVLVGEGLLRQADIKAATKEFVAFLKSS